MSSNNGHMREFGKFRLDAAKRVLWFENEPVNLALKQIEMLCVLTEDPGEVVTKGELLDRVWSESFVEESNLSRHVYVLRKELKRLGADGLIETVPRRGYRFAGELFSTSGQVVLERRAVTHTVFEQLPAAVAMSAARSNGIMRTWKLSAIAAAVLIVISVGSYAIFRGGSEETTRSGIHSIAILPFNSIGSNDDGGASGIGLADILITRLSNIREIDVRPTGSVLGLAGLDSRAAGERLKVDAVLEGTIARTEDNVRVTARLISVSDGTTIWAAELERPRADELSLQNEIAVRMLASLSLRLRPDEATNFSKRFTESPEAYDLYVRARYFWNKRTMESMSEAQRLFQNAVERDPNFALAYVGLADTVMMSEIQPALSHKAVDRALQIDPNLGEAHATLGFIKMFLEWNWDEAETSFKRSIELSPNYATSHHWYATLLAIRGQFDEAKREMRRAVELDPLSQNFLADLGQIHYFAGEYREAEDYCRRALAIDPDFGFAHRYLYDIYILTGDSQRAFEERMRYGFIVDPEARREDLPRAIEKAAVDVQNLGRERLLSKMIEEPARAPNTYHHNAVIYCLLGNKSAAIENLERAYEGRAFLLAFIKADPVFASLRDEPRYQEIVRKMAL